MEQKKVEENDFGVTIVDISRVKTCVLSAERMDELIQRAELHVERIPIYDIHGCCDVEVTPHV